MGSGGSKQGRRTRCASMPEGCHRLSTDDLAQTLEGTASGINSDTVSEHLKLTENNGKVPLDLQESVLGSHVLVGADIPQRASESEYLQTTVTGNSGELRCNSSSGMSSANISCATDSRSQTETTINDEIDIGTESSQSHDMCDDDNVFKSPHVSREEQQCISISSNNGHPLSEDGEQSGKLPDNQETKETHTEAYGRPPEISEATRNRPSAAELEPQTDLPDVVEGNISISTQTGASVQHSSANPMEASIAMSLANKNVEPVVTLGVDRKCGKGITEIWSLGSADRMDGLNDPDTPNENTGLNRRSTDIQGGKQVHGNCTGELDQGHGCEISYQTLLEQIHFETTAVTSPPGEESAQTEISENAANVRHGTIHPADNCVKSQRCSLTATSSVSVEQLNTGYSEGDTDTQTNTVQCAHQYVKTSVSDSMENTLQNFLPKEIPSCEDSDLTHHTEENCPKLDTIPEVSLVAVVNTSLLEPEKNTDVNNTFNPAVQQEATEQYTQKHPACTTEVYKGLHGNQASGRCFGESPASEVADGHSEQPRPGATVPRMDESDEAIHSVICNKTQPSSSILDGTNEPGDQKEDSVARVRMRKVRLNMM